jgi:hypothetical protein
MKSYNLALKGQDFLDKRVLNGCADNWVTFDLRGKPWLDKYMRPLIHELPVIDHVVVLHVPSDQNMHVRTLFRDLGFVHHHHHSLGGILVTSRQESKSQKDLDAPILRVEFGGTSVIVTAYSDQIAEWHQILPRMFSTHGPLLLLGTLGLDRHVFGQLVPVNLGLRHASCMADAESFRWHTHTPSFYYGLFTQMTPKPAWTQVCYVSPEYAYADCRPVEAGDDLCWLRCRILAEIPKTAYPLSMHLRSFNFKDHMPSIPTALEQVGHITDAVQDDQVIQILRFISIRNKNGAGQPSWTNARDRAPNKVWKVIHTSGLAKINHLNAVEVTLTGHLVLHMARFRARFTSGL